MKKISTAARVILVAKMNETIAACPLPEARQNLINSFTSLLFNLNDYKGFNYVDWVNGGFQKWITAGKPEDNKPFIGDETLICFY